ncbi:hypothetical protein CORC01_05470 [Colletotrichum orchidophilum]|uniref:Uncharacterized protein n=1 Tax=Colletotrichum orchidophilum TaxID=1209926 RepID=A0A1G4BCN5_9PEZI|nr:uncharacterized protein CORC01_05470 [Colletotrichum orchidophilum]OHE99189.1 hypothetical protein CORC01_05470 [Colletotrichum orchidophilum]
MTARFGAHLVLKVLRNSASTRYLAAATPADDSTTFDSGASPSFDPVDPLDRILEMLSLDSGILRTKSPRSCAIAVKLKAFRDTESNPHSVKSLSDPGSME